MWCVPVVLVALGINQIIVAYSLKSTWEDGYATVATVTQLEQSNRADVNFGYVSLQITLEDGSQLTRDGITVPYTLLPRLAGHDSLEVRVRPGAREEVAFAVLMPTHWHIILAQIGICALGVATFFGVTLAVRRRSDSESPHSVTE